MARFVIALMIAVLPGALAAQSLGKAAAREREKRQKADPKKPAVPSFSNNDLDSDKKKNEELERRRAAGEEDPKIIDPSSEAPPPSRVSEADPDYRSESGSSPDGSGSSDLKEGQWRARASEAWSRVRAVEDQMREAESQLKLIRDRLNPMSPAYEIDTNTILSLQEELGQALALVEARKQELASARQEYANFEREALLAGAPPGWVRPPQ
jgi:hypothetical protein